jgi:lipid-A-disaccharide synthase-like uncharacterized protein
MAKASQLPKVASTAHGATPTSITSDRFLVQWLEHESRDEDHNKR